MKKTWNVLNEIMKPNFNHNKSVTNSLLINGSVIENNDQTCETLNSHLPALRLSNSSQCSSHLKVRRLFDIYFRSKYNLFLDHTN